MKRKALAATLAIIASFTLSGCGPTEPKRYASLSELVSAYEASGLPCDWELDEDSTGVEAWGYCHPDNYISWWLDEPGVEAKVAERTDISAEMLRDYETPFKLLVGPNWLIREDKAEDLQKTLGGRIVSG